MDYTYEIIASLEDGGVYAVVTFTDGSTFGQMVYGSADPSYVSSDIASAVTRVEAQ